MSHAKAARRVGSSQEPGGNLRARSLLPNPCLRISLRSSFPAPASPPRAPAGRGRRVRDQRVRSHTDPSAMSARAVSWQRGARLCVLRHQ